MRISKMKVPFTALCLIYTTSRATASHAVDSWKAKGGLGFQRSGKEIANENKNENKNENENENHAFEAWEVHDTGLHSFLKESIPEALAHTGTQCDVRCNENK